MQAITLIIFFIIAVIAMIVPSKSQNKKLFWGLGLLLFLLAAFRDGESVNDYGTYVELFVQSVSNIEVSFQGITYIVKLFSENAIWLFIIYAALGVYLKLKAIKTLSDFWFFSLIIFLSLFFILHELTQIRVGVAAGFFLFAVKAIYDKNLRRFLMFAALATLFHYSAIVILPLWFLSQKKINIWLYSLLIPLAYIVYFLNINFIGFVLENVPFEYIQTKYSFYKLLQEQKIGNFDKVNVFNYVFLAKILIYYFLIWKNKLISPNNQYAILLIKIWGLGLSSFVFLASMPAFAFRVSQIFSVVEIITIPFLLYIFKPNYLAKTVVFVIAATVLLISIFYVKLIL